MSALAPQIKGFAIIKAQGSIDERLGSGWFTRTAQEFDLDWPARLLPGDWYPLETYNYALRAAYAHFDGYDSIQDLVIEFAAAAATEDLNGLLRAFLWVATPRMFLRTAPRIWFTYANFTKIDEPNNEDGRFSVRVTEIPASLVDWTVACWRGFLPAALELAGGNEPVVSKYEARQTPGADTWELDYVLEYQ